MASRSNVQRSKHNYGILANVSTTELESIRVGIKRKTFTGTQSSAPIERGLGDPKSIISLVHFGKDNKRISRSIFDREGIVVNKEEEQPVARKKIEHSKSRSYSRSDSRSPYSRQHSRSRSRSRSRRSVDRLVNKRRSVDRSRRRDRSSERKYSSRSSDRERSRDRRRSTDRGRSPNKYERRRSHSRDRDSHRERKKSITPLRPGEYRPNHPDLLKRRSREREGYKSRRSKSLSADVPSTSRKRSSSSPRRKSRSPQRSSKRRRSSRSPERYERKSRSSSPKHYGSAQYDRYSRRKSRSPRPNDFSPRARKRYSRSPEYDRDRRYRDRRRTRSRSPKTKDMSQFREPGLDFGYYEGIATPDLWLHPHPGMIRGYIPRFYPPFYPRGIPPHSTQVMFPPRYPIVPNIIRGKLPIYNNRQKPKIIPATESDPSVSVVTSNISQDETEGRCVIEEINHGDVKEVHKSNDVESDQHNGNESENKSTSELKTD
uniref:Serine/arginine repetitive matrix protein 2-like n=1 Tax=Diabrotica virgifera virgifera TaxID=50390 RepID=A0A6P7G0J0_DIAVI